MTCRRVILCLVASIALAACGPPAEVVKPADLLLTNGRVYTLTWSDPAPDGTLALDAPHVTNGWYPDAEAIAMRAGEIVFVGSTANALAQYSDAVRTIDLRGATVVPGLVDSHTHVFGLGQSLDRVPLRDVDTQEAAIARVAERAKSVPQGEWIIGEGWDEGAWANRYPDKTLLSDAVPNHPVFLRSLHGFGGWANQMALDLAGITSHTTVPIGGEMRLGEDGEPNGLFLNNAVELLVKAMPVPTDEQLVRYVSSALMQMARDGYVTVHDAGLGARQMAVLERLRHDGALPIRVYAMLSARDEILMHEWIARGPDLDNARMLVTRSVKAYYDGALGSRGARLLEDYADRPGHRGVSGYDYGFDEGLVAQAIRAGFQVGIHAIGDAGNRETLDFLQRTYDDDVLAHQRRHRIEHAQVLHADDLPRLAQLDVIASMEPPHAMEDKAWAEDRLGPARIAGAYAWRSLRKSGARLTFNADNPGSDHSIFYGLHSAVTRKDKKGKPPNGWYPEEALNIDEAVRAYTTWSAYAAFREDQTGVIARGRWADLTVMDIDPFVLARSEPGKLLDGQIVYTIVAGEVVYAR